jgi:hypothetical protein
MSLDKKRHLVHRESSPLSFVRQCEILEIHRFGIYFKPLECFKSSFDAFDR